MFVVLKNHHLQLEVLTKTQFSILDLKNGNSTNFVSSLTVLVLCFSVLGVTFYVIIITFVGTK